MKRLLLSCAVAALLLAPTAHAQTNDQSLGALFEGEHNGCNILIKGTYLFSDYWSFEVTFTDNDVTSLNGLCTEPDVASVDLCFGQGSIRHGFGADTMTCLFTETLSIDGTNGPMAGGVLSVSLTHVRYNALDIETVVTALWSNL